MDDKSVRTGKPDAEPSARVAVGEMPLSRTSPWLDYNDTRTELLRQCYKDEPYALAVNFRGDRYFMQFRKCGGAYGGIRFRVLGLESMGRDMTREDFEVALGVLKENPPKDWTKRLPLVKGGKQADDCIELARKEFEVYELKALGR